MAYYIIFFHNDSVIDVIRYSEAEYEDYMKHVYRLEQSYVNFQHGYF